MTLKLYPVAPLPYPVAPKNSLYIEPRVKFSACMFMGYIKICVHLKSYILKGSKFREEYIPTEEIQVESINWSYKNTEDVVKVGS